MSNEQITKIREQNDLFRNTFIGGRVNLTQNVMALTSVKREALIGLVRNFKDFTEDNDPYGEHDFGAIDIDGDRYFWKIDCYDKELKRGSEDPRDPAQTTRVLTIMSASEY